jgi:hypothetical protein
LVQQLPKLYKKQNKNKKINSQKRIPLIFGFISKHSQAKTRAEINEVVFSEKVLQKKKKRTINK